MSEWMSLGGFFAAAALGAEFGAIVWVFFMLAMAVLTGARPV